MDNSDQRQIPDSPLRVYAKYLLLLIQGGNDDPLIKTKFNETNADLAEEDEGMLTV